jgi:signal transduction histidine kinase
VLALTGATGARFSREEVAVATAFASHAAIALENSRLFAERLANAAEIATRERQQAAIARIGQRALAAEDVDALLEESTTIVAETLGLEHVAIFELSQDGTVLMPRTGADERDGSLEVTQRPTSEQLLATGRAVVFDDAAAGGSIISGEYLARRDIVSGVEVVIDGLIPPFGILGAYADEPRRFSEDDLTFLRTAASVIGMAIVRIRAESALRRHADRLRIMREIDEAILAARSSSETAAVAIEHLLKLVPCWRATVLIFDHEEGTMSVFAVSGACAETFPAGLRQRLEDMGEADLAELKQGRVHVVPDVSAVTTPPLIRQFVERGLRSYFRVPLTVRGELIGAITLGFSRPNAFSGEDVEVTREVGEPLAVAIDQARLHERVVSSREQLQAVSRRMIEIEESERSQLARELHDEIGQLLTGLKLSLERLERGADRPPGQALAVARQQVTDLMGRVRALSLDLLPAGLDDLGLVPALGALAQRYTAQTRIRVAFRQRGVEDRRFPREVEAAAYRIVQEALTNVARYAGVSDVTVRLWADGGQLGIQVEDLGCGFNPVETPGSERTGLVGMRERATLLGGRLDIESAPAQGTRITAELPLEVS